MAVYGPALTPSHHAARATHQLYFERVSAAARAASRSNDTDLAARVDVCTAAIRNETARASAPTDPHAAHCRAERLKKSPLRAARILAAVTDAADDIGPRSRWALRREMARETLDAGHPELAYKVAANHALSAPAQAVEAEGMAGWIALRGVMKTEPASVFR